MSKRSLTALAISLLTAASIIAANVKGKIVDSQGQPLIGATATLLALPDSTIITGLMTDVDGNYMFNNIKPRRYAVKASMTGMDTEVADFTVSDTTKLVVLPTLKLYETSTMLKELQVKGVKAAVIAKEDTLEFNADSFHTTDNAVVEDLLKKMPGIEVGSDGSITATGKSISKILVNGKEIFEDDPTMATKNLSAKMVSKVQVIDRKSDQARLTGVDDGEDETVINLTVKKGMEESWFGNIKAGYGTDGRYAGNFMINRMGDGNRVTIIGRANNTNEAGFGPGMGGGGGRGGINTTQMLGLNFTTGSEEKFAIGGDVSYSHSNRDTQNESETTNLLPDSVSYQNSNSKSINESHNVSARLRMKWEIDPNNTLDFRPSFNYSHSYSSSKSLSELFAGDAQKSPVNKQYNDQVNHSDSWTLRGDLTYVHRFANKKGRSLSLRAEYSFSNNKSHGTSFSKIDLYRANNRSQEKYFSEFVNYMLDENNNDDDLFRFTDNKTWNNNISARVTWTEPIGKEGNFLEFAYRINSRRNNADKFVYNLPMDLIEGNEGDYIMPDFGSVPDGGELSDRLSNRFRNDFLTQTVRFGYVRTTKAMNLNAGIEMTPSSSKSIDLINSENDIKRNVINFAPYFRFRYKFSKNSSMHIRYNARSSEPSISQLQPVPDVSDPMNIKYGNPDLKPTFTQRLFAMFNDYDMDSQRSINAMINGSYVINNVISQTKLLEYGMRETRYVNTSGNFSVMARGMYNQPLKNKNWRIFANLMMSYNTSDSYIGEEFNRSGNLNIAPRAGVTFSTEIVQISANPTYSWQLATNSLENQPNRSNSNYGFDADFTLLLPFGLQFETNLNFSKSQGLSAGYDSKSWIWDASLEYTIPGTYGLTIFAEAHDLLADTKNISRTVSAAAITDNRYNNLTRYFMFGLSWQFNSLTWKKTGKNAEEDLPMQGPGMMGPGGQRPMGPPPGGMGGGRHHF